MPHLCSQNYRGRIQTAFILLISLGLPSVQAADAPELAAGLKKLLGQLPHAQVQVSACVIHLPDGQVVFEKNARQALIPASNQKIITAAVALELLGSDFTFDTTLSLRGGNLVVTGSGDPGLGDPKIAADQGQSPLAVFQEWADVLQKRNLHSISGDILIDDGVLDNQYVHPTWEADDLPKWYAAPVGGLNFNDNCVEWTLWPTAPGKPVGYEMFPPVDGIAVTNQCATGSKKEPWIQRGNQQNAFILHGQCGKRVTLQSVAVSDPGLFAGQVFRKVLETRGIAVAGQIRRVQDGATNSMLPASQEEPSEILAVHHTPIVRVLKRALNDSQNLFAECLMKQLDRSPRPANQQGRAQGWHGASQTMADHLQRWGLDIGGLVIADGSGLSRSNRTSATQVVEVLRHVYADPGLGSIFMDSLSQNASDGTLRKRMKDIAGQVWAKTGYMSGVRSLSGYVCRKKGQDGEDWFAFSVLFNNIPGGTAPYNQIHDNLCRLLAGAEKVAGK